MADTIKIKKGLDIPMQGVATGPAIPDRNTTLFGIVPDDFPGQKWKCAVKPGQAVKAGDVLMYSKEHEALKLVSPVCGTVDEVRRGERRKIEVITVKADNPGGEMAADGYKTFGDGNAEAILKDKDALMQLLQESGLFAMMRQRPFDIVPDPQVPARDIFVTGFDSSPLAPALITAEMRDAHELGIKVLAALTNGRVFLSVPYDAQISSRVASVYEIEGPHPAGNVGVQIAHISPVNKGDVVWTLDSRTVVRIGRLLSDGHIDSAAEVALCGDMCSNPHIVNTHVGVSLSTLTADAVKTGEGHVRVISGNPLTGIKVNPESDFLRYPYRQVTLLHEGDDADEFMGWATLSPDHYSVKRSFLSSLMGKKGKYKFDARLRGGRRAMILSEEMDRVFPMDIYPEFLLKAIMAGDIDKMEQLGIYEVAPEDFALAEFVDTSKQPLQQIVRQGLDKLREELG